jgi:hypothetical protein
MSQQDNFSGGFFWGAVFGGIVGGALGALLASGRLAELVNSEEARLNPEQGDARPREKRRALPSPQRKTDMETARRSLEDKIAQLNDAIDDVRQRLGSPNGAPARESDRPTMRER